MKKFKRYVSFNQYFDCLIGQGAFGIAMKATYESAAVFIKQIKSYSPYVSDIFRKEALVLSQIKHENIIRMLGVCDDPVSIMTEYCCFSLRPFQRNEQFNSLDQLLLLYTVKICFPFFEQLEILSSKTLQQQFLIFMKMILFIEI